MKSPRGLNLALALYIALAIFACTERTPQAAPGPSQAAQHVISHEDGTSKTHSIIVSQLGDISLSNTNSSMGWMIMVGVVLAAAGCGVAYFEGPKLGGFLIIIGIALVLLGLVVMAIAPYAFWIALGGSIIGICCVLGHFLPRWMAHARKLDTNPST